MCVYGVLYMCVCVCVYVGRYACMCVYVCMCVCIVHHSWLAVQGTEAGPLALGCSLGRPGGHPSSSYTILLFYSIVITL